MAIPTSTNFTATAQEIITAALQKLRVLQDGGSASAAQLASGKHDLNIILKTLAQHGLYGWARSTVSHSLSSGTASYTIGPTGTISTGRPEKILGAFLRDSDGNDTPLQVLTKEAYEGYADKDDAGEPMAVWYDPGVPNGTVYLLPVTNASGYTLRLDVQRPLADVDTVASDNLDVPVGWLRAIEAQLQVEMAPRYGKPPPVKEAEYHLAQAVGWNKELPEQPMFGWPCEH